MQQKIGISTYRLQSMFGAKGAIEVAKKLGVDAIDFFTNYEYSTKESSIYSKSDEEIIAYYSDLKRYADELGITIAQTHGRLRTYMKFAEFDRLCLENARRDLLAASALGASVCVMHTIQTSVVGITADPQMVRDICYNTFTKMLEWAKEYNVKLATETFGYASAFKAQEFFADAKEFKDIYDRIASEGDNRDYFKVCIDTGHTNSVVRFGQPSVGDFIRMFRNNEIVCLHMHDNDGILDQHLPPNMGTIDWDDVFDALNEVGYDGVLNLEVDFSKYGNGFELETAEFSVKLLKYLLKKRAEKV